MGRRWIGSSANQASLNRALALISQKGGSTQGRLIIVRGEAGAGTSAFASRLNALLASRGTRTLYVPRMPFNSDFVFSFHVLKSLSLPPSSVALASGRRVERHYKAAMQLRRYQVVVCEDAHDFFHKHQLKVQGIYDSIHELTQPPYDYCVVLCGLHDSLTAVGHKAIAMGMKVTFFDLEAMSCDHSYLAFVQDVIAADESHPLHPYLPEVNTPVCASTAPKPIDGPDSPKNSNSPESVDARDASDGRALLAGAPLDKIPILPSSGSLPATEQAVLGAASFIAFKQSPLTPQGIDVQIFHEHTKGLIGNTVSVLKRLLAEVEVSKKSGVQEKVRPDVGLEKALAEALVGVDTSAFNVYSSASSAMVDHEGEGAPDLAETNGDLQLLLPLGLVMAQQMEIQLELVLDTPLLVQEGLRESVNQRGATYSPIHQNLTRVEEQGDTRSIRQEGAENAIDTPSEGETLGSPSKNVWSAARVQTSHIPALGDKAPRGSTSKKRKLFHNLLTPIHDETLGSWLDRNAHAGQASMIHQGFLDWCTGLLRSENAPSRLQVREGLHEAPWARRVIASDGQDGQKRPWHHNVLLGDPRSRTTGMTRRDMEYDDLYRSESFVSVFPKPLADHLAMRFMLPINATTQHDNRRYCAQCLADDVTAMRAPALRRAWRDRGAAVCTEHRQPVLLQQLEKGHLSKPSGAWQAFIQQTLNGHFDHGVGLSSRNSSGYQSASNETRICRAVRRIQDWVAHSPAIPSMQHPSKYCLYFMLGFFLYQPNLSSDGGIARWFFKGMKGTRQETHRYYEPTVGQMVTNIETAAPRSLAIGYLLLGCAFNLLTENEISLLRRELHFTEVVFPQSRDKLKLMARCFQRYHLIALWESAVGSLPAGDVIHFEWLLNID